MSEQTNYCTLKGLGWAFLIIIIGMVGMPILGSAIAYPDNCKQSILIPCIGLQDQMFNAVKEIIWHLTCTSCSNWFTYATMEEKLRIERYTFHCPHCGKTGVARINNEKEN